MTNSKVAAAYFRYDGRPADGTPVTFEGVDAFAFNAVSDTVRMLTILHDNSPPRDRAAGKTP